MFHYVLIILIKFKYNILGESVISLDYQTRVSVSMISTIVPEVCRSITFISFLWLYTENIIIIYVCMNERFYFFLELVSEQLNRVGNNCYRIRCRVAISNCIRTSDDKHINCRLHNYKGGNSIILMALVDANCRFMYADIDCNGRYNDAGVFLESNLRNILEEEKDVPQKTMVGNGRYSP